MRRWVLLPLHRLLARRSVFGKATRLEAPLLWLVRLCLDVTEEFQVLVWRTRRRLVITGFDAWDIGLTAGFVRRRWRFLTVTALEDFGGETRTYFLVGNKKKLLDEFDDGWGK